MSSDIYPSQIKLSLKTSIPGNDLSTLSSKKEQPPPPPGPLSNWSPRQRVPHSCSLRPGLVSRLIISKMRLLSLTLYFLDRASVSRVSFSPAQSPKPRIARPGPDAGRVPPSLRQSVKGAAAEGNFLEGAWHEPEGTTMLSPHILLLGFPGLSRVWGRGVGRWKGRRTSSIFLQPNPPGRAGQRYAHRALQGSDSSPWLLLTAPSS